MKKFFKLFLAFILGLLPGLIFAGVGFCVVYFVLIPPLSAKNILKKGSETTAIVQNIGGKISTSTKSGATTKRDVLYKLTLSFENSDGNEIVYKTRTIYPKDFIRKTGIEENKTIQVIYSGNKAVVKGFVPKTTDDKWLWLFPIIFGAIGLLFVFLIIKGTIQSVVLQYGKDGMGRYVSHTKNEYKNSIIYNINFTFVNQNGETFEGKTAIMDPVKAEALIERRSFPVKYIGKSAVAAMDSV